MDYDDSLDDLDTGIAVPGPWLDWHAANTHNGAILAGGWSLREAGGASEPLDLKQMVFDWPTSRTGWKEDTGGVVGVSPRKQWNASRKQFEKPPADGKWRKAMQVQIARAADQRALWEQNVLGAYIGYVDVMRLIAATARAELPKLPLLAWTGKRSIRTSAGPTLVPGFALVRYVPPPACLIEMRELMAPPAAATAPKVTDDAWAATRAPSAGVAAPVSQASGISRREQINEEVPIEAYGDLNDEIPW